MWTTAAIRCGCGCTAAIRAANCALAIEAALGLCDQGYDIPDEAILAGLERASLPARAEVLSLHPPVLLDGAHNPDSAAALAALLKAHQDAAPHRRAGDAERQGRRGGAESAGGLL